MPRAQGSRAQMALGFESVYGTPPAANRFWKMPFATSNLGSEQPLLASELLGFGRDALPPVKDAITVDGDAVVPIDLRYLGVWLKLLMGEPISTGLAAASGTIVFSAQPAAGSRLNLGRDNLTTVFFRASAPAAGEVLIGATLNDTLNNLVTVLNGITGSQIAEVTYSATGGNTLVLTYDVQGGLGNTFRMIVPASPSANATPSGATLTGGRSSHEFRSGSWDLPSAAIEIGLPEVPYFAMCSGVKANQISWQMQRSGLVTATVGLIAQKELVGTASLAGTLTELAITRFGSFSGTIRRNNVALGNVTSGQITYANNLDRIETIRADGAIDGLDPGMAALSGSIDVRFADQVLLNQAIAGDACELAFAYELGVNTTLTLTAHEVFLPKPRVAVPGPQGIQTSFAWQAARDPVLLRSSTAVLINDHPNYANP